MTPRQPRAVVRIRTRLDSPQCVEYTGVAFGPQRVSVRVADQFGFKPPQTMWSVWLPTLVVVVPTAAPAGCKLSSTWIFATVENRWPGPDVAAVVLPFPHIYSSGLVCHHGGIRYRNNGPFTIRSEDGAGNSARRSPPPRPIDTARFWAGEFFGTPFRYFEGDANGLRFPQGWSGAEVQAGFIPELRHMPWWGGRERAVAAYFTWWAGLRRRDVAALTYGPKVATLGYRLEQLFPGAPEITWL